MRVDVQLQRERFADWIGEAMPLLDRHWHEIAHYRDIPLDIDREGYINAEALDFVRLYTMRDGQTRMLMGYALYLVAPNLHYRQSRQARQDVFFLAPEYRGGFLGSRLLRFADECLARDGVQVAFQHVKIEHPALGVIAQRNHYEPLEVIWGKRLDKTPPRSVAKGGEETNKVRAARFIDWRESVEDEDAEHLDNIMRA